MNPVRILFIEDSETDALLVEAILAREATMIITRAQRLSEALALAAEQTFDVILTDLDLPDCKGLATFEQLYKQVPHLPIIVLTIKGDLDTALAAIQSGAQDYLPKTDMNELLLSRTVRYAIERKLLMQQLRDALEKVKTLSGMLPICSCCKKIRDDKGYWNQIETYISKHTDASFSHSFCPQCAIKFCEESGLEVPDHLRKAAE